MGKAREDAVFFRMHSIRGDGFGTMDLLSCYASPSPLTMLSVKFSQTVYAHQALLLARLPSTIVLRGYPPTVPLAPHAHWGCGAPRRRQASLGHGDACKGCLQWDASKGCGHGGCGHGCVICLWSSARCVSGGHVLIARHAVLPHCNMRPQHSHHHSPRSLWLSLCHRPATV